MSDLYKFFKASSKVLTGALDDLKLKAAALNQAGELINADTIPNILKRDPELSRKLSSSYADYVGSALKSGSRTLDDAKQDFVADIIKSLPTDARKEPQTVRDMYLNLARHLDETLPSVQATKSLNKFADLGSADLLAHQKKLAFELESLLNTPTQGNGAFSQAIALFARNRNPMPVATQGQLPGVTQPSKRSIPDVLAEIAELRSAPNYPSVAADSDKKLGFLKKSANDVLTDLVEGKPVSDSDFRTLNTQASTGKISAANWAIRHPVRALGTAATAWVVGSSALSWLNPENPHTLGKYVIEKITGIGDQNPEIPDYSEFLYNVYTTKKINPLDSLKTYFGIDVAQKLTLAKTKEEGQGVWDEVISKLLDPRSGTKNVMPEVKQGLLMYATMQRYGRPGESPQAVESLKKALSENASNAGKAGIQQSLVEAQTAPALTFRAPDKKTPDPIGGKTVPSRIDALEEDSLVTEGEATKLRSAWQSASKKPDGAKVFADNARAILSENKEIRAPADVAELTMKLTR